jgi:YggT family protein
MRAVLDVVLLALQIYVWLLIASAVLSWLIAFNVINTSSDGVRRFLAALDRLMEPLYRPIRKILPDFGGIDFSPIILILAIQILRKLNAGLALESAQTLM